ncbi:MAG: histidine kinase [bacterium]
MKKSLFSITNKLIFYVVIISFAGLASVGLISNLQSKDALFNRTYQQLNSIKSVKSRQIESFYNDRIADAELISQIEDVEEISTELAKNDKQNNIKTHSDLLNNFLSTHNYYKDIAIINIEYGDYFSLKNIFNQNLMDSLSQNSSNQNFKKEALPIEYVNHIDKLFYILITAPIQTDNANQSFVVLLLNNEPFTKIMLETDPSSGIGRSGETYIVGKDTLLRTPSRFLKNSVLKTSVKSVGVLNALAGLEGKTLYKDYRDIDVIGAYSKLNIKNIDWYIISELDANEANKDILELRKSTFILILSLTFILILLTYFISKRFTQPLVNLTTAATSISTGKYLPNIEVSTNDEIGELTIAFNQMSADLKLKDEELISERHKSSSSIIDALDNERKRLSREIHDGLGQNLIAIKLKFESIDTKKSKIPTDMLDNVKTSLDDTIKEIRTISNDLMPAVLSEFGLYYAVKNLCSEMSDNSAIDFEFVSNLENSEIEPKISIYLFRIIQEAAKNIIQHSGADKATVYLSLIDNYIKLEITDNGKGFDFKSIKKGNGLYNIKERVNLIDGNVEIISKLNLGTIIIIEVPNE